MPAPITPQPSRLFDLLPAFGDLNRSNIPADKDFGQSFGRTRKAVAAKLRQAARGQFLIPAPGPAEQQARLPPGQKLVNKWPVLDLNIRPRVTPDTWGLVIDGAVRRPLSLAFGQVSCLPQTQIKADIHCVTSWSRFDMAFGGVLMRDLVDIAGPAAGADHVLVHSLDGYTTSLTLAQLTGPTSLLAHEVDGKPLNVIHGGPVRLIIPDLYFWKSAKWVKRIEIRNASIPGFWEKRGYHPNGNPWAQERYSRNSTWP